MASLARSLKSPSFLSPRRRPAMSGRTLSNSSELSLASNHSGRSDDADFAFSAPGTPAVRSPSEEMSSNHKCWLDESRTSKSSLLIFPSYSPRQQLNCLVLTWRVFVRIGQPVWLVGFLKHVQRHGHACLSICEPRGDGTSTTLRPSLHGILGEATTGECHACPHMPSLHAPLSSVQESPRTP